MDNTLLGHSGQNNRYDFERQIVERLTAISQALLEAPFSRDVYSQPPSIFLLRGRFTVQENP